LFAAEQELTAFDSFIVLLSPPSCEQHAEATKIGRENAENGFARATKLCLEMENAFYVIICRASAENMKVAVEWNTGKVSAAPRSIAML